MSAAVLVGESADDTTTKAALFDKVSGWAFGPVFSARDQAESFLRACDGDAHKMTQMQLAAVYVRWLRWWTETTEAEDEFPQPDETPVMT